MKKLDTSRPYATVHGEGEKPWHFEQDGARFGAEGEHVSDDPNYKPPKAAPGAPRTDREIALERQLADANAATEKIVEAALAKQAAEFDRKLAAATGKGGGESKPDAGAGEGEGGPKQDAKILAELHDLTNDELRAFLKKNRTHFEGDANKERLVELAYPLKVKAKK